MAATYNFPPKDTYEGIGDEKDDRDESMLKWINKQMNEIFDSEISKAIKLSKNSINVNFVLDIDGTIVAENDTPICPIINLVNNIITRCRTSHHICVIPRIFFVTARMTSTLSANCKTCLSEVKQMLVEHMAIYEKTIDASIAMYPHDKFNDADIYEFKNMHAFNAAQFGTFTLRIGDNFWDIFTEEEYKKMSLLEDEQFKECLDGIIPMFKRVNISNSKHIYVIKCQDNIAMPEDEEVCDGNESSNDEA